MALLDTLPIGRPPFNLSVEEAGNFVAYEVFGVENRAGASFFFVSGDSTCRTGPLITAVLRLRRRWRCGQVSHVDEFSDAPQQVVGETVPVDDLLVAVPLYGADVVAVLDSIQNTLESSRKYSQKSSRKSSRKSPQNLN